jgi:hypothetical protein
MAANREAGAQHDLHRGLTGGGIDLGACLVEAPSRSRGSLTLRGHSGTLAQARVASLPVGRYGLIRQENAGVWYEPFARVSTNTVARTTLPFAAAGIRQVQETASGQPVEDE